MARNDHSTEFDNVLTHIRWCEPGGIVAAKAFSGWLVEIPTFANGHAQSRTATRKHHNGLQVTPNLQCNVAHSQEWPRKRSGATLTHIECREIAAVTSNRANIRAHVVDYSNVVVLHSQRYYYITHSSGHSSPLFQPGEVHNACPYCVFHAGITLIRTTYLTGRSVLCLIQPTN